MTLSKSVVRTRYAMLVTHKYALKKEAAAFSTVAARYTYSIGKRDDRLTESCVQNTCNACML